MKSIKKDFPILSKQINGKRLAYLDNAASTQKPKAVIDALSHYEMNLHANVHRGIHRLSQEATQEYEKVREKIKNYINAEQVDEIIYTKGTTESINLLATSLAKLCIHKNDEIVISTAEHHANIVPWQQACQATGAKLVVCPIDQNGDIELEAFNSLLSPRTKIVSISHISNVLGSINPIEIMIKNAKKYGAITIVDAAQSIAHLPIDVTQLGCDFLTFSAHKIHGPTGTGILYGKYEHLTAMPPFMTGGDMIKTVSFEQTTFNSPPYKFEAGTPNISGVIGLGYAVDYLSQFSWEEKLNYENSLTKYLIESLSAIHGLRIIGNPNKRSAIASFVLDAVHPHDIATILDEHGVAIRAGHHCAMPLMEYLELPATARASLSLYNDKEDIDQLCNAIEDTKRIFQ